MTALDTKRREQQSRKILFNAGIESDKLTQTFSELDQLYITTSTTAPTQINSADVADLLISNIRNDAGNADCLQLLYGDRLRFDHTRRMWLAWDGQRWEVDQDAAAQRMARETAKARLSAAAKMPTATKDELDAKTKFAGFAIASEGARQLKLAMESASYLQHFATTIDQYDSDPFLANAGPVTLELKTGTARDNQQDDYITKRLGANYDPKAKCPRWNQFLGEIFNNDADLIAYIQRAVGYSITGDTHEQKLFLCHGGGANGKSIFFGILSKLLGEYAGTTPFDTFDAETSEARQDLAKLRGTRLVTVIETDEDRRLAEARVKSVTGGDVITARELYAKSFDFLPTFKLWLAMNHKPSIRGIDRGIWRRIVLIPFAQSFEGREDFHLDEKLEAELSGILNWALEGLKSWLVNGLGKCAAIEQATNQYKQDSDVLGQWLSECAELGPTMESESGALYQSYVAWCERVGLKKSTESRNGWARRMGERDGITRREGRARKSFYVGVGLFGE